MFAVLKTGGKQYKVAKDDVIKVEKLAGEAGDKVEFKEILMLGGAKDDGSDAVVGTPLVAGASVKAEVLEQGRGEKIIVFKKKRRQNYRRKKGHRQDLTVLRILDIKAKAKKAAPKKAASKDTAEEK
jgi:large subunit ribosomal protein L21